ncbi:MAG: Na+/H+ antiporter subunit B [Candidatus Viridilinea halotolerans]|uniref:Na+/H+ antiporter subunit B n=1 Tax=Candidatus Viridilinea halotolerans TaxID=2491704 RepID=A0A426TWG8_9CHLR|nr:MAG: Na+/H+ antiporter subunit B [Candidatus Viridilinea halotolerans]
MIKATNYDSIVLRTVARLMMPLLLLLSVFMLLRGHNLPGGGFIGGLVASSAIIMQMIAFGPEYARRVIRVNYLGLAAVGILVAVSASVPALLVGLPFMRAFWLPEAIPGIGKLGTPVVFDVGVFLLVIAVTTKIAMLLSEEPDLFPMHMEQEDEEGVTGAPKA